MITIDKKWEIYDGKEKLGWICPDERLYITTKLNPTLDELQQIIDKHRELVANNDDTGGS